MSSAKIKVWQIACLQADSADLILIGRKPDNEENACFLSCTADNDLMWDPLKLMRVLKAACSKAQMQLASWYNIRKQMNQILL